MFAIQSGKKFLNARFYIDPNKVFDLTVSATPKTYKTRSEVDRVMTLIGKYLDGRIASTQKHLVGLHAESARAEKAVARLEATLAALVEQPYKAVAKKVKQVENQLEHAREKVKPNYVNFDTRELRRLEQIRASGAVIVKMQPSA